jgi:ribonucleoside-diphosphate reductase alpha chain
MYRDNCKADQPLSAELKKSVDNATKVELPLRGKKRMPLRYPSVTYRFRIADAKGYLHVGVYPDTGEPGEIFINIAKQGSTLAGVMDAFAISISMGLQYGVPLEAYVKMFMNMTFEPQGITDDPEIRFAKSLMDYIFRKLAIDFLPADKREALGIRTVTERTESVNGSVDVEVERVAEVEVDEPVATPRSTAELVSSLDAPYCSTCGVRMRPAGNCFACESCGSTSGCS